MKIYNEIRWNIETGEITHEDSFEYVGPMAECKGGGSTTTNTQDTAYNARLAAIQESQQEMAETAFYDIWTGTPGSTPAPATYAFGSPASSFGIQLPWATQPSKPTTAASRNSAFSGDGLDTYGYRDLTLDEMKARGLLIPQETDLFGKQIQADIENLPSLSGLEREGAEDARSFIKERAPVRSKYFEETLRGLDPAEEMNRAQASVEHGSGVGERSLRSKAFEYGGITSNQAANIRKAMFLDKSRNIAGARTTARNRVADVNYARLKTASAPGGQ